MDNVLGLLVIVWVAAAWLTHVVVSIQSAKWLLLLVGAGLFSASLRNLLDVKLGFRSERMLQFNINATQTRRELAPAVAFYRDLEERLAEKHGSN